MKRTYVLIHGAWYGGWVWDLVAGHLRDRGHLVFAPSLTGLGDRQHLMRQDISLDTHAQDIIGLIESHDLSNVKLVAWSYGGMVAGEVMARLSDRIASVVYIDAFLPEHGKCLLDYSKLLMSVEEAVQAAIAGRPVQPISIDKVGYLSDEMKAFVSARLCPQPVMTFLQKSNASKARPNIPHSFVLAEQGHIPAIHAFYEDCQKDPAFGTHSVDEHHLMILTNPKRVADLLLDAP